MKHYSALDVSRSTIAADLARVTAMAAAWDEAADALKRMDFAACDEALSRFRAIHKQTRDSE